MSNRFDEMAKEMAQSVTRRGALKKFGVGLAGIALACFGLAMNAEARGNNRCLAWYCQTYVGSLTLYVCGGGKPGHRCVKIGIVDCGYCSGCC